MKERNAPKTIRGLMRRKQGTRSDIHKILKDELYKLYKDNENPEDVVIDLEALMKKCGLEYEKKRPRDSVNSYLIEQRKTFDEASHAFFENGQYDKYELEGMSDDEKFRRLVRSLLSRDIFPLVHKTDGYRLWNLNDFLELKRRRLGKARAMVGRDIEETRMLATAGIVQIADKAAPPIILLDDGKLPCLECRKQGIEARYTQEGLVHHHVKEHWRD